MTEAVNNTLPCDECGATPQNGLSCWEHLGLLLAWEYDDPDLQAEHFVTVAAYNLQHPAQFTDEALSDLRSMFIEHLDHNLPVSQIRGRLGPAFQGAKRVLKAESERQLVLRPWTMTIADVYLPHQPQGAADRVRAWAARIRREL